MIHSRSLLLISSLLFNTAFLNAQTVTFSKTRGFNTVSFSLTLTTDLAGGTIKYTTDGTPPSAIVGTTYSAPISITTTAVIRAIAVSGATTTKVFTYSYIFPNKVKSQKATIPGWPNNKYALGDGTDSVVHDYEMDPDVINDPAYSADITNSLKAISSLSIVMDKAQFWEMYDDPAGDIEHPASVEYLDPKNSAQNEQFDCKIEGHSWLRLKRSMHLGFDDPGLNTKIFRNAPLNGTSSSDHFDDRKIVLRAGNNDAWSRNWNTDNTTYTRDEWYRASQLAINGYGSHGTFVHLYINGIYWGLYNPVERPDDGFAAEYLGGSHSDWLSLDQNGIKGGDPTRYNYLVDSLTNKDMADTANYKKLKKYLNVSAFADYMIISWMPGMDDWPGNNYYGVNRNSPTEPFMYFAWDCEWSWTSKHGSNNGAWVSPPFRSPITSNLPIPQIWKAAKANPDFMMLFADRVYKNCFNSGAMTDSSSRARWATINNFISMAIIAESARWGDALNDGIIRTKNGHWLPEVNRIDGLMNGNVNRFITALRALGYYPTLNPPNFNREGGHTLSAFQLAMTNPNGIGTIYYTINGTDPRLQGGALSPDALVYSAAITINSAITIKARVKNGNEWSALHEGAYALYNLKINEFMANNTGNIVDENGELEDWIELYNNTPVAVNIGGMYMTDLLSNKTLWRIPNTDPPATTIPPYGYKLLWADQDTSDGILHVNFKLTATGEQIGIAVKNGASVGYLDSLVFTSQVANASRGRYPDGSSNLQKFTSPTPGQSNLLPITGLFINEFLASNQTDTVDEFGQHDDWFEIYNNNNTAINVGGLFVTDNLSLPTKYRIPTTNPPATTIPAKGFLLLWADQELAQGPLHVDFKLGNSGEQLGIVQLFGSTPTIIDSLTFGAQSANVSRGRLPNGTSTFAYFTTPTPGASNQLFNNVFDCNGVLNGTAALDDCGVCSGGNTGHVANSDKDACGVCFGNGSSCAPTCVHNEVVSFTMMRTGTTGEYGPLTNGTIINLAVTPQFSIRANVCDSPVGSVRFIVNGSTVRTETAPPYAINGDTPAGSYIAWNAGVGSYTLTGTPFSGAGGSGTAGVSETISFTIINQAGNVDCNGVPNGTAAIDDCGVCAGGNTGKVPNANKDCNGACFGTAVIDGCGICAGGNTGKIPNANKDCNGVCFGTASLDGCGICSGGNTGHVANSDKDSCGVCFGNGSTCGPTCVHNEVISFTIMRTGTAGEYAPLTNGTVINLGVIPQFSIRANVCDNPVGSVRFLVNGSIVRTETTPPYAINGDTPTGSYLAWNASAGSYTLEGRPYSGASGTGTVGISETVSFTVVNQSGPPDCNGVPSGTAAIDDCGICAGGNTGKVPNANKDCNGVCFGTATLDGCGICSGGNTSHIANSDKDTCGVCFGNGSSCAPHPCVHNEVVSFTLMHTGTAGEIGLLTNGMTINKTTTGPFSIRANVCDSPVGSVRFILNGTTFRTETSPPYAINGDSPVGSYTAWNPNPGSYTLEGKPFSGASGSGTAGISKIISFTVINAAAKMDDGSEESFQFSIYPNPNSGSFRVEAFNESISDLTLQVYNTLGQIIFTSSETEISGNLSKQITLNPIASGVYYVEMKWGEVVKREKVVVEE